MKGKNLTLTINLFLILNYCSAQITFQKTFGGTGSEGAYSVQQTSDGGYIIAGTTESFGAGGLDAYVIKTNANGDTLWTKTYGGTGYDVAKSIQQTFDGGYIITGITASFGAGGWDAYLLKTDANGNIIWTKTYGGTNADYGNCVQQTSDSGYIITGATQSFGALTGFNDVYLIKTDANGNAIWEKTFGGLDFDAGFSTQQTSDGGYIITGWTANFGIGGGDVYLIKTDTNGSLVWTKTYGTTGKDVGESVKQTTDGGYIIFGETNVTNSGISGDACLIKTNSVGDTLWTKTFGGIIIKNDFGYSGQQTNDGGYIICGLTFSFSVTNTLYLIKTDSIGNIAWSKIYGGDAGGGTDYGYYVQQTSDNGYIITGNTSNSGAVLDDIYLIKTDSLGNSGCNEQSVTTISTNVLLQITNPTPIVSSGGITGSTATIVSSGCSITNLCSSLNMKDISPLVNLPTIFPNPSSGNFIIKFPDISNNGSVAIYSDLGEKIFSEPAYLTSTKEINLKNIAAGIYFVKIFDGGNYYCKKLIVEHN